jgi:ferredoxin
MGVCVYWAPNTFDLGDDGVAVIKDPSGDPPELIRTAIENCPLRAISIVDDDHCE